MKVKIAKQIVNLLRSKINKNAYHFCSQMPKFDIRKDYFNILQISREADESQVKKSYYRLAKLYHPDTNPGKESKFKQINQAYSVLSNENTREQYVSAQFLCGQTQKSSDNAQYSQYRNYRRGYYSQDANQQWQYYMFEQARRKMRKLLFLGVGLIIITFILAKIQEYQYKSEKSDRKIFHQHIQPGIGYRNKAPPNYYSYNEPQ